MTARRETPQVAAAAEDTVALARAFSARADIELVVDDAATWSWTHETRTMTAVRSHLELDPERARATTVHEMGHAALSRFDVLRPVLDLCPAEEGVLRALEEGRIEQWMVRRFPGAAPWIAELRSGGPPRLVADRLRMRNFTNAVLFEATREPVPRVDGEDAEVRAALEATRDARRRYLDAVPPVDALAAAASGRRPEVVARYRGCVVPLLVGVQAACDPVEVGVRVAAAEAAAIVIEEVLPVVRRLLEEDVRDVAAHLAQARGTAGPSCSPRGGRDPIPPREAPPASRGARARGGPVASRAEEDAARAMAGWPTRAADLHRRR